jgi:hypothetical protein
MSSLDTARYSPTQPPGDAPRLLATISLALALSYTVFLAGFLAQGYWLIDQTGHGIANEFVNVWATGHIQGHAAGTYDWDLQRQAQTIAIGHPFSGDPMCPYPPTLQFATALIASTPYVPASATRLVVTGSGYVAFLIGRRAMLSLNSNVAA